jgi:transposase
MVGEPVLPSGQPGGRVDDRGVISGIVHVLRSGCRPRGLLTSAAARMDDPSS